MCARKASGRSKSEARPRPKGAVRRQPKSSAGKRKQEEQDLALIKQVDGFYRPLREAGEAELAKTAAGKRLLKDERSLGNELSELYQNIASGKVPYEEGHRLARQHCAEFRDRHQAQYLKAYRRHAHLQPSIETIAHTVYPETAWQRVWQSETAFLQALLLKTKPPDDDVATATQGLRDPHQRPPLPLPVGVHSCLRPPYPWRADFPGTAFPTAGELDFDSEVDGHIFILGTASSVIGWGGSVSVSSWVGGDFAVPAGITSYAVTIDYDFDFGEYALAILGIALANLDVAIEIDKMDGTPNFKAAESVSLLIVPVAWMTGANNKGNARVTLPFTRATSDAGTVTVRVGADGRSDVWAFSGAATFIGRLFVREICLDSTG